MRHSGLNISLSGGVIDTAMAVYGAARRASEVDDDRLAALHAAKAGQTLAGAGNMAGTASDQFAALGQTNTKSEGGGGSSGINLRSATASAAAPAPERARQNVHTGSRIGSEGDVSIVARGWQILTATESLDTEGLP